MLFNSWTFAGFFAVVYVAYLALQRSHRTQNAMLLVASYVFYGTWDWRFLSLLCLSTVIDYGMARFIHRSEGGRRRAAVLVSIVFNLGVLGFFKYFNFFVDSFADLMAMLSVPVSKRSLDVVLPIGISFYTFQTMSYTIDVYRRQLEPARSVLDFALFVAFFPQLVAGPIERATNLLPQITAPRHITWTKIDSGMFLVLWGLFKKVVIADNMGIIADEIFGNHDRYRGVDLVCGALAFTAQIYNDFSGYSDIARGTARLLGFELMINFKLPYLAQSPGEFWRRWHVSLSQWLRDYLYVPLGGNRRGPIRTRVNLLVTMALGGLWHRAAWNFVLWGVYHGLWLALYRPFEGWRGGGPLVAALRMLSTFVVVGWVLFRAESLDQVLYFARHIGLENSAATSDTPTISRSSAHPCS